MDTGKQGPPRVGLVCRFPPEPCGIAATYIGLANELKKKLQLTTIGTLGSDADYKVDFKAWNLKERIRDIVDKEHLDLVHFQYIAPFYSKALNLNFIRALTLSVPTVVTLHEVQMFHEKETLKTKLLRIIERQSVRKASAIITHTPKQAEFINNQYATNKARYILYGFDSREVKRKPGKRVLFFGILSEGKGVEYAIEAMKVLPDCTLSVVGATNSPATKEYGKRIKALALKHPNVTVVFKDWIGPEERDSWYTKSDVLVLPYLWAPYQSAVMTDAGRYGIPVVVTNVGAVWEMAKMFKCGEIVEPANAKAIAEAVKNVLGNRESYHNGIEAYRAAASWKKVAEDHRKVYDEVR